VSRIFLLSPADCGGARARQALSPRAAFPLAAALRSPEGARLGEVFAFVSGLYFRGKLTYARRFASPPHANDPVVGSGVQVITPTAGLVAPDTRITAGALRRFARARIDADSRRYRRPLERSARELADAVGPECTVVLLGSIASPKYVDVLGGIFGQRLCFPQAFVGRGDMSRGGLLMRQVRDGVELEYVPVAGAVLRGKRPARLTPWRA
jgi:hypothetical protein